MKNMRLANKIVLLISVIFLIFVLLSYLILKKVSRDHVEDDLTERALVLIEAMLAVRNYTAHEVAPMIRKLKGYQEKIYPTESPNFAAKEVFSYLRSLQDFEKFTYKEIYFTKNQRIKHSEQEKNIFNFFKDNDEALEYRGLLKNKKKGKDEFVLARPLIIDKELSYKSHTHYANKTLKNNKDDKIIGFQIVKVPAQELVEETQNLINLTISIFISFFSVMLIILYLYIRKNIVLRIEKIAKASTLVTEGSFVHLPNTTELRDEIGSLYSNFNIMVDNLKINIQNLSKLNKQIKKFNPDLKTVSDIKNVILSGLKTILNFKDFSIDIKIFSGDSKLAEDLKSKEGIFLIRSSMTQKAFGYIKIQAKRKDYFASDLYKNSLKDMLRSYTASIADSLSVLSANKQKDLMLDLNSELNAARMMQSQFLPSSFLEVPRSELAAFYQPARKAAGDWYGFYYSKKSKDLYLYIGDVTGHGQASALLTGVVTGTVKSFFRLSESYNSIFKSPKKILEELAHQVNLSIITAQDKHLELMMTMVFVSIDITTGKSYYINAGHRYPFLVQNSSVTLLKSNTNILGLSRSSYKAKSFKMNKNDYLFLYTDGLLENPNLDGEKIHSRKLSEALIRNYYKHPKEIIDKTLVDCRVDTQSQSHEDDISIFCMRYLG